MEELLVKQLVKHSREQWEKHWVSSEESNKGRSGGSYGRGTWIISGISNGTSSKGVNGGSPDDNSGETNGNIL